MAEEIFVLLLFEILATNLKRETKYLMGQELEQNLNCCWGGDSLWLNIERLPPYILSIFRENLEVVFNK
jgi:hypothetical protein